MSYVHSHINTNQLLILQQNLTTSYEQLSEISVCCPNKDIRNTTQSTSAYALADLLIVGACISPSRPSIMQCQLCHDVKHQFRGKNTDSFHCFCCCSGDNLSLSEDLIAEVDERRKVASGTETESQELSDKKRQAYIDLIMQMDRLEDEREQRYAGNKSEGIENTTWHAFLILAAILSTCCMVGYIFISTNNLSTFT